MKPRLRRPALTFLWTSGRWLFGQSVWPVRPRLAVVALVVACLLLAAALWQDQLLRGQLRERQAARGVLAPAVHRQVLVLPAQTERLRANQAIRQLNTPWPALFAMLEAQSQSQSIAILSVEPNIDRATVRIQTEGLLLDDLLSHASRLGQEPLVRQLRLFRVDERETQGRHLSRLTFDLALAQ